MLEFKVEKQKLTRLDVVEPATDSEQYLKAKFTFNDADWNGKAKTAYFRLGDAVYKALLDNNNECVVPSEVLIRSESKYARTQGSKIFVSLIGEYSTTRITTDEVCVVLNASGYSDAEEPKKPTESEYQQILTQYANNEAAINEAKAECEGAMADLVGVKNIFANAIKGNLSGSVVKADDVSPVEHEPIVKVHGKNLFYSNIDKTGTLSGISYEISKDTSTITLTGVATQENALQMPDSFSLSKGTYSVSVIGINSEDRIYLRNQTKGEVIVNHIKPAAPKTFTLEDDADIRSYFVFKEGSAYDNTTIKIQIEKGATVTDYEEHVNPSTMVVKRCGKNLLKPTDRSGAGYTATVNENGSVTVTGSANTTNGIYLTIASPSVDRPLLLHKGKKYFIQSWSNNEKAILIKCVKLDGGDAWTSPSQFNQTGGVEYKSIVQVYVESTKHEVGDTSLCGTYRFQLEVGEEGTDFEQYKEMSEHTPSADGTVEGISSLSPNMTIMTDTEGAIVECEYIKDTNKVIQKIADALNITI